MRGRNMNIYRPIIGKVIENSSLEKEIEKYKNEMTTIENKLFAKEENLEINAEDIEFEKCIFKDCRISGNLSKSIFHDVKFENCDFSNCVLSECSFIRVETNNSKFVGSNFTDSRIYHFSSKETSFKYTNFSNTNIEEMIFNECDLSNSSFYQSKIKHIYFEKSQLIQTDFFKVNLKGIDFSTSDISGIITSIEELKGAIVNNFQAIELSKLLGIIIK